MLFGNKVEIGIVNKRHKMKILLLVSLIVTVYTASAVPTIGNVGERKYQRFIEFPDDDGVMHKVDLEEEPDMELLDEIARNPANNEYRLYTRRNPTSMQRLFINNENSITSSNFNPRHETVVVAHGWLSNQKSGLNTVIRDAYLRRGEANVIILDWRRVALYPYPQAVRGVPAVGRGLGQFLAFLNRVTGAPFNTMHLVGFSLGGHLVGNAGRELGGRVARVTGLDPAGPLWNHHNHKLRASDGIYVEGIHTDGDSVVGLGYGAPLGDADFFPNGGTNQPGCWTGDCSHNRAWEFFAATVTHNHLIGNQCANMREVSRNNCHGKQFHMGNSILRKFGLGIYRVNTGSRYPF